MMSEAPARLLIDRMATPIGEALIVTDGAGMLRAFNWADYQASVMDLLRRHYRSVAPEAGAAPTNVRRTLQRYFEGDIACLAAIECRTAGTQFQRMVWKGLTTIAPGRTLSYGALAAQLGCPKSVRAVGLANGANPIGVVIPCHRVIGADGSLTGYGGGLERKRWLLKHEGCLPSEESGLFGSRDAGRGPRDRRGARSNRPAR